MTNRVGDISELIVFLAIVLGLFVWVVVHSIRNAEDPARMAVKWAISVPALAFCIGSVFVVGIPGLWLLVCCAVVLSFWWTPHIGELMARPITNLFDGGNIPPELRPAYSIAQAKQKRGEYRESIAEIQKQLEQYPTDLEGHILQAQIFAEDLKDLPAAEAVIERLCSQPGHAPANITFAHYSMADWHIKFGHDLKAARHHFQEIIRLFPDSEFAAGAAHRIAHLPGADGAFDPNERKKFNVPQSVRNLGLLMDPPRTGPQEKDPAQVASDYVRHLHEHPLDTEAREKLALIYADHYGRLELATDQFEQMIQSPTQPAKSIVRWLNLLADIQIRHGANYDTVRQTLQRIIDRDPNLAAAENARKRIDLLKLELKAHEKPAPVKLGTYEQRLGLKSERPKLY
jgi:tetratricopeptide (TPR) repeat protein